MDAEPLLAQVAAVLRKRRLSAVLIGNAAAALQGSPVSTMDLDFMFRKTPANLTKLKRLAEDLGAVVMRPYYPASGLYRVMRDADGMQLDFMTKVHGIRSFEALRARASRLEFRGSEILVADLRDIIAARPPRTDRRIARYCRSSRGHSMSKKKRRRPLRGTSALAKESERALVEQIRRQLALPPERRTHFLRVRRPGGGSAI
jgi:hypothetical protein